jgi:hypothetical protein
MTLITQPPVDTKTGDPAESPANDTTQAVNSTGTGLDELSLTSVAGTKQAAEKSAETGTSFLGLDNLSFDFGLGNSSFFSSSQDQSGGLLDSVGNMFSDTLSSVGDALSFDFNFDLGLGSITDGITDFFSDGLDLLGGAVDSFSSIFDDALGFADDLLSFGDSFSFADDYGIAAEEQAVAAEMNSSWGYGGDCGVVMMGGHWCGFDSGNSIYSPGTDTAELIASIAAPGASPIEIEKVARHGAVRGRTMGGLSHQERVALSDAGASIDVDGPLAG